MPGEKLHSPAFQSIPESRPGRAQVDTWNCGSGLPWMALARNAAAARAAEPECTHANAAAEAATVMVGESRLEAGEPREKAKPHHTHTHTQRGREREREKGTQTPEGERLGLTYQRSTS